MSFHSIDYLLFLPLVVAIYFLTPHGRRWIVLLVASNLFYMSWRVEFATLLWLTTCIDYSVALAMPKVPKGRRRAALLAISLVSNLGMLFFFKYFALAANTWMSFTHPAGFEPVDILLPLGISFYTFQTLGYVIDVYRGRREPERHLGYFSVYIMFFPQLVAGPIERPGHFLPQLRERHVFSWGAVAAGGAIMLVGYYKKLVIADRLAEFVPIVMSDPLAHSPALVTTAALASIYRFYADLSGYADIAIGSALMMGFRLTQNFRRPFAAVSIVEFWQRWHITVTTWFRDYIFLPIARGARGRFRKHFATILTIVIISIWHGAAWTWLLTGFIAGLLMVAESLVRRSRSFRRAGAALAASLGTPPQRIGFIGNQLNRALLWFFLLMLGTLAVAPSVAEAFAIWARMAELPLQLLQFRLDLSASAELSRWLLLHILLLEIYQAVDARKPVFQRLTERHWLLATGFYYALAATIVLFGVFTRPEFIYFKF